MEKSKTGTFVVAEGVKIRSSSYIVLFQDSKQITTSLTSPTFNILPRIRQQDVIRENNTLHRPTTLIRLIRSCEMLEHVISGFLLTPVDACVCVRKTTRRDAQAAPVRFH